MDCNLNRGVYVPLATPCIDGDVDVVSLAKLRDHVLNQNPAGMVVLGRTAESERLNIDEKAAIATMLLADKKKDLSYIMGVNAKTRSELRGLCNIAKRMSADALLFSPWYSKQIGIEQAAHTVREASDLPIVLYHNPENQEIYLELEQLSNLCDILGDQLVAVKNSDLFLDLYDAQCLNDSGLDYFEGNEQRLRHSFTGKMFGAVCGSANVLVTFFDEYFDACKLEKHIDLEKAIEGLNNGIHHGFDDYRAGIKYQLQKMGIIESAEMFPALETASK